MHGSIPAGDGVVSIDQGAIRGSRRSNPATYTGLLEPIRKAFAKANGVKPALFSANSEGACPACNGAGVIYTDLAMMSGVATVCEVCEGKRFQASVLDYHLGGRDISEVLAMSVTEAEEFFGAGEARTPAAHAVLARLVDVGLGYISLGQPLPTLSGGERQRLKLATHMGEKGTVYVLDEPTTGLHLADVENLLGLLDRLVDSGKSVIVIEHHQAVMAHADWIIDLGPGAGHDGGLVVFEGTPADLVATRLHPDRRAPRRLRQRLTRDLTTRRDLTMAESKKAGAFTEEERDAMKERAKETRRAIEGGRRRGRTCSRRSPRWTTPTARWPSGSTPSSPRRRRSSRRRPGTASPPTPRTARSSFLPGRLEVQDPLRDARLQRGREPRRRLDVADVVRAGLPDGRRREADRGAGEEGRRLTSAYWVRARSTCRAGERRAASRTSAAVAFT